jgi:glycosyltransferase involved in cell wall biosynthesis
MQVLSEYLRDRCEGEILPNEDVLVSVVIPFFNRITLLPRALKSVINQTHKNLEIIVVDDGSSEDASEVLSAIHDERVRLIRHDKNRGVSAARNTGFKAARGEYISFLDSDDEWFPEKTEKQLAQLKRSGDKDLVSYCFSEVYSDKEEKVIGLLDFSLEGDLKYSAAQGSAKMTNGTGFFLLINELLMTREQMLTVGGFDEFFRMHEDWEFLIRLAKKYRFICTKEYLVRNHKHERGHITDDFTGIPEVRYRIMEEHRDLFLKYRDACASFYSEQGYFEGINGHKGKAILSLAKCIAFRPLSRDPYIKLGMLLTNRLEPPRMFLR